MSVNTRVINATPAQVWEVLSDGWLYPLWVVGATRMRDVDDTWPLTGAKLHHSVGVWPPPSTTTPRWWPPSRCTGSSSRPVAGPSSARPGWSSSSSRSPTAPGCTWRRTRSVARQARPVAVAAADDRLAQRRVTAPARLHRRGPDREERPGLTRQPGPRSPRARTASDPDCPKWSPLGCTNLRARSLASRCVLSGGPPHWAARASRSHFGSGEPSVTRAGKRRPLMSTS